MLLAPNQKDVKDWMEEKSTIRLLESIAAKTVQELVRRQLLKYVLPHYESCGTDGSQAEDMKSEILSTLVQFLLESPRIQSLLLSNPPGAGGIIRNSFRNHLVDMARNADPYRRLYRNAQEAIRACSHLSSQANKGTPLYFFRASQETPVRSLLVYEDLSSIPFPYEMCGSLDYSEINRKTALIALADYFLDQVGSLWCEPCPAVDLNSFTGWIRLSVAVGCRTEPLVDSQGKDRPYSSPGPMPDVELEAVRCAAAFAHRLREIDREVFELYECLNLSHEEVKVRMGRNSYPTYQKTRIEESLRNFLMPFSWSRESMMFSLFIRHLCDTLKKIKKQRSKTV